MVAMDSQEVRSLGWDENYRAEWTPLVRQGYLMLLDREAAEDAVQTVFIKATRRPIDSIDDPPAYLRRAVTNECRSVGRRRQMVLRWTAALGPVEATPPEELVEFADVLGQLSLRQRVAVVMRVLHGNTDSEITAALGCRPGTARSLVSRGLARLREVL